MAVTLTHDQTTDPSETFLRTVNTRIAGGGRLTATATPPLIVVDVREFRSSLPSLLHARAFTIIPCMLTVADYVLSPTICVERKSIRDLAASFRNGRLYAQAEAMLEHYTHPMLLIEFDAHKAFTLDPVSDPSTAGSRAPAATPTGAGAGTDPADLQARLVLLTLRFPRLRVIWSSSPFQTAETFAELKRTQPEPDPVAAVRTGLGEGEEEGERSFSAAPMAMLRAVPGVTDRNLDALVRAAGSFAAVANLEREVVESVVGREAAAAVWRFFNRDLFLE
jgi:DNA excision repair protein ERCC-4